MPTVQHATRQIVAAGVVALALAGVSAASQPTRSSLEAEVRANSVRVTGCTMEDDCRMEYRAINGEGTWIVRRDWNH